MQQQSKNSSTEQMAPLWWNGNSVDAAHLWGSWSGVHGSLKILAVSAKVLAQKHWGTEGKQRVAGSTQDNHFFLDPRLLPKVWSVYKKISFPVSGNESQRETYSGLQYFSLCKLCYSMCENLYLFTKHVWSTLQHPSRCVGNNNACPQGSLSLSMTSVRT